MSEGRFVFWLLVLVFLSGGIGARLASGSWGWQPVLSGLLFAFVLSQIGHELRKSADHTEGET